MTSLLLQLRERKVFQWAVAYLAGAWVTLQVLQFLSGTYGWPQVILRVAPIVIAGGLLVTLLFAWYHGHVGRQRIAPLEMLLLALILLATTTSAILIGNKPDASANAVSRSSTDDQKSVAVLPFASLSDEKDNAYFASGIHDELLTQLAQLGDLKVISRTSVLAYKDTRKTIRQIAKELGVAAVLEGSVQRAGNRVRVQAQLIDALTDGHLWAQSYDRDLTDVFAIQSDIAQQIAKALQATLTKSEKAGLEKKPTQNADAYDAYLRGRQYHALPGQTPDNLESAIKHYQSAIALDPNFAVAHAWLSQAQGQFRWYGYDMSDERLAQQQREAEAAVRLDANLPEARMAAGFYQYWGRRNYPAALQEFTEALRLAPGQVDLMLALGALYRRQGKFAEGLVYFEQATRFDPRNADVYLDGLCETYTSMRRYGDAINACRTVLTLAPDLYDAKSRLAWLYMATEGKLDSLRTYVAAESSNRRWYYSPDYDSFRLAFFERDWRAASRVAERAPDVMQNQEYFIVRTLLQAWAYQRLGDPRTRAAFDSARVKLEREARMHPDDARVAVTLAHAYAGLGRSADGIRMAAKGRTLLPLSIDALQGPRIEQAAAEVFALAGAKEEAIALIEQQLARPGNLTVAELRLNPLYDALRSDPRFKALIK